MRTAIFRLLCATLLCISQLALSGPLDELVPPVLKAPATRSAPAPGPQRSVAEGVQAQEQKGGPAAGFDYSANLQSNVFGAQLFAGNFARSGAAQFSPDYAIAVGDQIQVRFWGGFEYEAALAVDPKGNIFLPHVGPVQVLGVRNADLQRHVEGALATVFRANVYSYASLVAAQPVRVYVGGFVNRPGLYSGTSMDSLLHYLDQAGGIDTERGTFLLVEVKRGSEVRATVNLYDFLLDGRMPLVQFSDGDVIFVGPRQHTVQVSGLAQNARRFEFGGDALAIGALMRFAKPSAQATHVRVVRNSGAVRNTDYYPLESAGDVMVGDGDEVAFTADKKPGTITVRVEGEHDSAQEYVLPYGTRLGALISQISFSERSDTEGLQLFRLSVKERQTQLLQTSLNSLENAALTARSGTNDEAALRKEEADLLLRWVDRARKIEPLGQVLIAGSERDTLLLENGDVLKVPVRDGLILIGGEVLFPNAVAYDQTLNLKDYIDRAGGYTQNADASRVLIAHRDGSFDEGFNKGWVLRRHADGATIRPGDQVLVLPRIDVKSRQIWKDLTQIIYYIAVSAKVVNDI